MSTLNYTNFDFATIKTDIITLLSNDNVFKDYNFSGSNINTIIELISGVADLFNFYINALADESYISSADLYQNVNKLVELIGYNPNGYVSSTTTITLASTITFVQDDDYFEIPKWSEFSVSETSPDGDTIKYVNPSKLTYIGFAGVNNFTEDIYLVQGTSETQNFIGTGEEFQKFEITEPKATEEYVEITIDGEIWTKVDNLYRNIDDISNVFTTRYNKNEKVEIQFGDGIFGVKPNNNSSIIVTYVKTLGDTGVISANVMTGLDEEIQIKDKDTGNNKGVITFTITQSNISDGGRIPLTAEEISNYGPKSFRTQDRAVTSLDHEDLLISEFNEFILQAVTLNSDNYFTLTGDSPATSGLYYNNVYLYILPKNGNTISGNLQLEIQNFLEDYKMTTINYILKNLDYRYFDVNVEFKILTNTLRTNSEVSTDIETIINNYFLRSVRSIGDEIKYSDIISQLQAVSGISSLTMSLSSDLDVGIKYENINLGSIQFPLINTITISPCGTGD